MNWFSVVKLALQVRVRGGGVGVEVECSPTEAEDLGSIPGVERNFSVFTPIF